eukprot:TRINITY_DN21709_c0_g1_i1.p1 TRINITY_DN21709_c0_g1~~TRINITY_DN21709_c0_g1_i1.p1  ORF type:complete len:613 (-),score=49.12 TRINITY_DN21709_c0_g1_i1:124-1962(-)
MMLVCAGSIILLFTVCVGRAQIAWPASIPELCFVPSTVPIRPESTCSDYGHGSSCEDVRINIAAQRGETESAQLLLRHSSDMDSPGGLTNVSVRVVGLSASAVDLQIFQVGYVEARHSPRYPGSGGGWRPDPLLPMPMEGGGFDVAPDQSQSIWFDVRVGSSALPGTYDATVLIECNEKVCEHIPVVPLQVSVWASELPPLAKSSIGTAWSGSWSEDAFKDYYGDTYWRNATNKRQWFDVLLQARTPPDSIYQSPQSLRPIEDYVYLTEKGVQWFAILEVTSLPLSNDSVVPVVSKFTGQGLRHQTEGPCPNFTDEYVARLLATLKPIVTALEAAGIAERAYIYGFDENPKECEPQVRKLFGATKHAFPRLRTAAVLNWSPMPVDLPVDIWILQYQDFNTSDADRWARAGKMQWQYHCIEPSSTRFLNTFLERRPIQPRLLFWLAALLQAEHGVPTGWLYYAVNKWSPCKSTNCGGVHQPTVMKRRQFLDPSDKRYGRHYLAFTDFPPANYIWQPEYYDIFANGDGQYLYPCEHGPCSTIRLSAIRDGLEDWELFLALGANHSIPLLRRLVRSATDWTEDPALLEATRREAAALLNEHGRFPRDDVGHQIVV